MSTSESYPIKATLESIKEKILHCDTLLKAYEKIECRNDLQSPHDSSIEDEIVKLYVDIAKFCHRKQIQ